MSDRRKTFSLPATIGDYLTDTAIRTGVDALLDIEPDALPPDLAFDELDDYYAARAAAELTRFDWAGVLLDLWKRSWGEVIGSEWIRATPDEMLIEGYAVTPETCWDEDAITVFHRRGTFILSTAVSIDAGETQLGFSVETKSGRKLKTFDLFVWRNDKEWGEWLVLSFPFSPANEKLKIPELKKIAATAVAAANNFVETR